MNRVDVILDSTLGIELLAADQTTVFPRLKVTL